MQQRLHARARAINIWLMAPLLGFAVFLAVFAAATAPAQAATSSYLNFQARLLGTTGTPVSDGTYNIDFKLYNADSTTGTVGTCSGSCLWEETRQNSNSQGVQVINGYFSVNLGSVTAFPAINWDQPLWLTMNIGGTSSSANPTWDGEMQNNGHSIQLTALPYSFVAGQLAKSDSSGHRGTLAFNTVANNPNILLPDASGTVCLQGSGGANGCGYEGTSGNDFIQNQTSSLQQANFRMQSAAPGSIAAAITGASGQSVDILDVYANGNGTPLFGVGAGGLITLQPGSSLTAGQTAFAQTVTNGSTTGGTVNGINQTITVNNTTSASTTHGVNITITDNTSGSLVNNNTGISINLNGTNSSQKQIGEDITVNAGIGLRAVASGAGATTSCNGLTIAGPIGLCGGDSSASSSGGGVGILGVGNSVGASLTTSGSVGGAGLSGFNNSSTTSSTNFIGVRGAALGGGSSGSYTAIGTLGIASALSSTAKTYGGYFTLDSGSSTTAGAALYASNSTIAGNIVQFQDNSTDVFKIGDGGLTTLSSNSASGLVVNDSSSSKPVLTVDTSGDAVVLGKAGASGLTGKLTFNNAAGPHTVSILGPSSDPTASFTLTLPSALPNSTQCLQGDSTGALTFSSCVTTNAVSTIGTYSSSNHYPNGASISGSTLTLGSANATNPGLIDTSNQIFAGNKTFNGNVLVGPGGNSTSAFQVQNTSSSSLLTVNTTDGYVINNGTANLGNEIQNPGFESSGSGDGTGWYTPGAGQAITNDPTNAHGGNYTLEVAGNSSTHAITTKYYAVNPGDQVYISAYVKNSAGTTGDGGIYIEVSDKDKGNASYTTLDTGLPGTSYVLKSTTITIPTGYYYIRVAASVKATSTAGTFYFDDFYMKKVNESASLLLTTPSTTAFQVQNASAQTVLGIDSSNSRIFTGIPNGASAVGFTFNTPSYTTAGAKLLSLQNNLVEKFSVDKDGNVSAAGGISAGGDISTTGNLNIGSGKQYQVGGTQISSANLSNDSNLAKLNGTGPQVFSGDNKFTATLLAVNTNSAGFQVQNASNAVFTVDTSGNKVILGAASALTGVIQFQGSGGPGTLTLTGPTTPNAGNYTLSIPAITANANICTDNSICANYASTSSLTSGLATKLNKGAVDTSSHAVTALEGNFYTFTNTSSNVSSGVLKLDNSNNLGNVLTVTGSNDYGAGNAYIVVNNTNGTPTGNLIDLQANSASKFSVDASGNVTAAGNINIASGKLYEIGGTQISTSSLSDGANIAFTNANNSFSGANTFSSASNSFTGSGAGLTSLNATNVSSGTLNDNRLTTNVALLNRSGQIFTGDNTFAPTTNGAGTIIRQTSGTATTGSILDVQTADGTTGHFLQITNAAANAGAVTLQSVGATQALTLGSGSGTIVVASATSTIQTANTQFNIDVLSGSNSTLYVKNSGAGVASLDVEGSVNVGASGKYTVNGTQISSANLSNDSDLAKRGSANTFTAANTVAYTSTTAFQVQNGVNAAVLIVDTSNRQLKVMENAGSTNYALIYYDTTTATANYTANTGTVAVGIGAGAITVTAGSGSAVNITANAASNWKTTAGTLTLQSGSGTSDYLILNSGGSGQVQVSGSAVVKLGSATSDPTCTSGAIYYNSTSSTFRGCQNGSWATLSSITPTLQSTYTQSTGGSTPEIKVDSTRGGVDIQDADTSIGGVIFGVRMSNVAGLGTSMFAVDTSNNSVNIGSSIGHSTNPVILVLDNYSNSGADPTGVLGAMYYNGTNGKFRCYDGTWRDCMTGFNEISKTSDQAATQSSTTFQNDSTLFFAMAANTNYVFDAWIPIDDSNGTALGKYTFTAPTGAVINISTSNTATFNSSSTTANNFCNISTSGTSCALTASNAANFVQVRGFIRNGSTAGNLQFQFAQNTSTAASFPVVKAGAVISWRNAN